MNSRFRCSSWWRLFSNPWVSQNFRQRRLRGQAPAVEILEVRLLPSNTPIISEFLASNSDGLQDEDGESSDWIEIYNPSSTDIDLGGWSLTDDSGDLNQWVFPTVTIGANQFLTVFASGKNRTSGELHTNFKLSADGEYLALVDSTNTVVSAYAPSFPTQITNISFGVGFDTSTLIAPGAATQVLIPNDNSLGATWTAPGFNPAGWTTGTTGVGFGVVHPGFNITYAKANVAVENLGIARDVLTTPSMRSNTVLTTASVVNYMGNGGGGNFGAEFAFPTQTVGEDIDDFVVQAAGTITIPATGDWTFGVNSDDGFGVQLERNGTVFYFEYPAPRGASDTLATFNIPEAGDWNVSLVMYERGGGASAEFFAAQGAHGSFNAVAFHLVGDDAAGGLAVQAPLGAGSAIVVGTNLSSTMLNINPSAFIRIPFNVADPAAFDSLLLKMRYDDGFVAYINGVEVARRNAPGALGFNSTATTDRSLLDATTPEIINLTPYLGSLTAGSNVLAIQGLNSSIGDDSFLVLPELTGSAVHPEQLRYFKTPTPGDPNIDAALGVIGRVTASVAAGFYNAPISVALSTPSAGATIRYTVDGSTPTATNGIIYTGPVSISTTTTLRAGAFRDEYISLPTITRSYLYLDDIIRQSPSDDVAGGYPDTGAPPVGWPETWGNNVVDYGMDQTIVDQYGAAQVKAALAAMPTLSITTDLANLFDPSFGIYANAGNDGRDWERPASVEMINPGGTGGFQINAGLRVRGGFSRSGDNPKHAFRLFFRSEYGDSTLNYPVFGTNGASSFQKLDVRTAQNYSWSFGGDPSNTMIQDGFARQSQGDMGQPYTRSIWVQLYLDGQYWGIYQIEERPEAEFASSYLGGNAANYDVIKPEAGPYNIYATDGNLDAYYSLWQAVTTQDLSNNTNYFHLQGKDANGIDDPAIPNADVLLDVDNLIVYMLGILHGGNLDAPISAFLGNQGVNNFFAIRDRTGRRGFTYIQHDAEHTLHNVGEDRNGPFPAGQTFERFNPQFLHQQLMANAEYRLKFADAVQKYFFNNGPMTAANSVQRFQKDVDQLYTAIIAESARWGDAKRPTSPLGQSDWLNAVAAMEGFLTDRNPILLQQFINVGLLPNLDAPQVLVNGVPENSGQVSIGSLLRFAASSGIVYYTTDGTDPRLPGGGINPAALTYDPSAVATTLLAAGSSWKYYDQATDQGTAWRAPGFNDSTWSTGSAQFGYGDGDETTTIGYGPNASSKYITSYFRSTFSVSDPSGLNGLLLRLKRDDGAVVYINGVEATRSNMPAGTITASTLATSAVGGSDEQTFYEITLNPALLQLGTNTIAVEIHQSSANSTDVSFDAELIASLQSNPGLIINSSTHILARALATTTWSPASEAALSTAVAASAANLAITEIHYNPVAMTGASTAPFNDKENFEFIELRNIGSETITLAGVRFTVGITFDFSTSDVVFLAPGQHVVVVKNRQAFEARYGTGINVAGEYGGNLNNGGEQLRLVDAANGQIQDFTYDDEPGTTPPWPVAADGGGYSLTVRRVTGNYNLPSNWRASHLLHGTPGYEENDNPGTLTLSDTSVNENEPNAVVAAILGTDPNVGDTLTYTLVDDAGGRFAINGTNLVVANGVLLDFETQNSYSITLRATDIGGLFLEKGFTITVANVNEIPTDIALSAATVDENLPTGTVVGTFTTTDPDAPSTPQTFTYSLLSGDVSVFTIDTSGNLKTNAVFNFESKAAYSITVRSTDQGNLTVDKTFAIGVNNNNDAPTDMTLSHSTIAENRPAGSTVGTVTVTDPDSPVVSQTFAFTFVAGDLSAFTIDSAGVLATNAVFNFEAKSTFTVTVRVTDQGNLSFDKQFTIGVLNENDPPTAITLTSNTVPENMPLGTAVGTFGTVDPDAGDSFGYSLVDGTGSTDNVSFSIVNGVLRTATLFNINTQSTYLIRVSSTDQGGQSVEQQFVINVVDVNDAPTDISLSFASVQENLPSGTVVGNFSTTDPDTGNTFVYSLVSGQGSVDNSSFRIVNGQLVTTASFDFETKNVYNIRVRSTDPGSLWVEKEFTISVTNSTDAPTDIGLSNTSVAENQAAGAVVGTFSSIDPDAGNTFTYTLVTGTGSNDNTSFAISNGQLVTAASFNFETQSSYLIRVRSTDQSGLFLNKQFTVTITNINEQPTDLTLTASSVNENLPPATIVGNLTSTDPDSSQTFSYLLVSGPGSTDNSRFTISNGQLLTGVSFDFEVQSLYLVRIRTTDQNGLSFEKQLTVTVLDRNEAPTDITLPSATVIENQPAGTVIGAFSTTDQDVSNTFTYLLVSGAGDTDNARFGISNGQLVTSGSFDFETRSAYSIRVRTTDQGGLTFEKQFSIGVTDANDSPMDVTLTASSVLENQASGTVMGTFNSVDPDTGNTFQYLLVTGLGSSDNASFNIINGQLVTTASFDYEAKNSYLIRVRSTDQSGGALEKQFNITISNVNELPTDIILFTNTIAEEEPTGTLVGTFSTVDPDSNNTFTYSLTAGVGATDNDSFTISNGQLFSNAVFNLETQSVFSIRVLSVDQGGLAVEKIFTVQVTNKNEAPIDITLSATSAAENRAVGTIVGSLSSTDPDNTGTVSYTLVAGEGSTDNSQFVIVNSQLQTAATFNFEGKAAYSIRIRATDEGGLTFEKQFAISVLDINEVPTNVMLSNSTVSENSAAGTVIGNLNATDPDVGSSFSYSLVSGFSSTDNASFTIVDGQLLAATSFDFESKNSYTVRVRATDQGGLSFDKILTIGVSDVNEAPTSFGLSSSSIAENAAAGTLVGTFSGNDPDGGAVLTYSLVAGIGSDHNDSFSIIDGRLVSTTSFNFETQHSYSIRVSVTDQGGLSIEKQFTIQVVDANDLPVILSGQTFSIAENSLTNSVVGVVAAFDADTSPSFNIQSFSIASGNTAGAFGIDTTTGQLSVANSAALDFETTPEFRLLIALTDGVAAAVPVEVVVRLTNVNEAPTIGSISSRVINEDSSTAPISFTIGDFDTAIGNLVVSVASNNQALIPDGNIVLGGTGANRVIGVTPASNQSGSAMITILVSDGVSTTQRTFEVTVNPLNDAPTISALTALSTLEDTPTTPIAFTIDDIDSPVNGLTVTASSSNPTLIPNSAIVIDGTTAARTLVITPAANRAGVAVITVTVSDGTLSVSQEFEVTVIAADDPLTITLNSTPLNYRVSSRQIVAVDDHAAISDVDTANLNFDGAIFTVSGQRAKDRLSILKTFGAARKGKQVLVSGVTIGTLSGGKKGSPLTITLNSAASDNSVRALLRSIGFRSLDHAGGTRTLKMQIDNVAGQATASATRDIEVSE